MKFLLDTHILLYWLGDMAKLSARQMKIIQAADAGKPLWVSDISLWEIATLHSLGRIQLQYPLRDWLEAAVAPPLVCRVGISPAVASAVGALPNTFHRDPGDRIIVASTQVLGATLLTHDRRIITSNLVSTLT